MNAKFSTPLNQIRLLRRIVLWRNACFFLSSVVFWFAKALFLGFVLDFLLGIFSSVTFCCLRFVLVAAACCCVCFCNVSLLSDAFTSWFISSEYISVKSVKCPPHSKRVIVVVLS